MRLLSYLAPPYITVSVEVCWILLCRYRTFKEYVVQCGVTTYQVRLRKRGLRGTFIKDRICCGTSSIRGFVGGEFDMAALQGFRARRYAGGG